MVQENENIPFRLDEDARAHVRAGDVFLFAPGSALERGWTTATYTMGESMNTMNTRMRQQRPHVSGFGVPTLRYRDRLNFRIDWNDDFGLALRWYVWVMPLYHCKRLVTNLRYRMTNQLPVHIGDTLRVTGPSALMKGTDITQSEDRSHLDKLGKLISIQYGAKDDTYKQLAYLIRFGENDYEWFMPTDIIRY